MILQILNRLLSRALPRGLIFSHICRLVVLALVVQIFDSIVHGLSWVSVCKCGRIQVTGKLAGWAGAELSVDVGVFDWIEVPTDTLLPCLSVLKLFRASTRSLVETICSLPFFIMISLNPCLLL